MISSDDAALLPVVDDAAVLRRAGDLIGCAIRRQLWFLFFDGAEVQLPVLVPVDGLPVLPAPHDDPLGLRDRTVAEAAEMIGALVEATGASSVAAVLERPGPDPLDASDRAWARVLDTAAAARRVRLRAVLLSSDDGLRWIGPEDRA